jgi:hypothetical protein
MSLKSKIYKFINNLINDIKGIIMSRPVFIIYEEVINTEHMSQPESRIFTRPLNTEHMSDQELAQYIKSYTSNTSNDVVTTYNSDGSRYQEFYPEIGLIKTFDGFCPSSHVQCIKIENGNRELRIANFLTHSKPPR